MNIYSFVAGDELRFIDRKSEAAAAVKAYSALTTHVVELKEHKIEGTAREALARAANHNFTETKTIGAWRKGRRLKDWI